MTRDRGRTPREGWSLIVVGLSGLGVTTVAMLAGREPFATWYYPCAWLSTLLAADGVLAVRTGELRLLGRPGHLASLLGWSAVLWLVFELANLRLRNWYYVFVPRDPTARIAGVLLSFATVLPAVFVAEALLASFGLGDGLRTRSLRVDAAMRRRLAWAGAVLSALPLVWPRWFFPLVWIGPTLLLEPFVHRADPARSLLGDLERGATGRIVRLLAGGAAIGLLWELFNARARGKWIYTVPGFEELKLFEMPLAGFLGFPPFALECFVVWQALELAGLAVPRHGSVLRAPLGRRVLAAAVALAVVVTGLRGMHRITIASMTPRLRDVAGAGADPLRTRRLDPWRLAGADGDALAAELGVDPATARHWVERARLVTLRGIGAEGARALQAAGVRSVEDLAQARPADLAHRLRSSGSPVPPPRVRVWVAAARRVVAEGDAAARRSGRALAPASAPK